MGILSNISGKKAVKMFIAFGYNLEHQTGSHIILSHKDKPTISIPNHKELAPVLLRGLIRKCSISVEEFISKK